MAWKVPTRNFGQRRRNPRSATKALMASQRRLFGAAQRLGAAERGASKRDLFKARQEALAAAFGFALKRGHLRELASMDPKNPIENDAAFNERVFGFLRRNKTQKRDFSFAIVDLDFLKRLNDRFGHQAGDDAIHSLAVAVSKIAFTHKGFAGRFGGDEFKLLIPKSANTMLRELSLALSEMKRKGYSLSAGIVDARVTGILGLRSVQRQREKMDRLSGLALKKSKKRRGTVTIASDINS